MRITDRLVAWLLEVVCEAIGTCFVMGFLFFVLDNDPYLEPHNPFLRILDFLVVVPVVLLYFGITGYLFTTAYAAVKWRTKTKWFYPSAVAGLYIFHSQVLLFGLNGSKEPLRLVMVSIFGAGIAFGCALGGSRLIERRSGRIE